MTIKEKLQTTLNLIQQYLKKQERKDWITPEDKRYTKIVKKYQSKLSILWKKTRDAYLKKFVEKDLTDFEDDPEQYNDPQYDSSNYIDDALLILAVAFGEAVIIGYDEIINRDLTVEIPEDPNDVFNTAKEIKNYERIQLRKS